MKTFINILSLLIYFNLLSFITIGQDCLWSSQAGGTYSDQAGYIVLDQNGNSYIGGGFNSEPIIFNTGSANSLGQNDMAIIKYDPSGNEVWAWAFGGYNPTGTDYEQIGCIVIDTLNSRLLVTGSFYNSLTLPDTVLSGQGLTIYLLVMDFDRNILWARAAGGAGPDKGYGITYDLQGNIYISGTNQSGVAFQGITIPKGGFLAKYDKYGNLIWAKNKFRYHQASITYCEATPLNLCFLNQNLIVNGNALNKTIVIDTISITIPLGTNAAYLASFSPEGNVQWLRIAGAPYGATGRKISSDGNGNVFITGEMGKIGFFGQDTLHSVTPMGDCFVAKFSPDGTFHWARNINASNRSKGYGVIADKENNVYFTGTLHGTAHFGPFIVISESTSDMFLARYTGEGTCIGVNHYSRGVFPGIAVDNSGNIHFGGTFYDTLAVGPQLLVSRGSSDMFATKCSPITGIIQPQQSPSNTLLIYANPNTGECKITIPDEFQHEKELNLEVYDQTGRLIQQARMKIAGNSVELDISAQAKGLYHAILSNGKKSYSGKIIFE
ncbi:MAG: T9SS type A sorting domain-containing protein [Bacteroidota bacterium]